MTDPQRFNRCWICHAMTIPVKSQEQYYYGAGALIPTYFLILSPPLNFQCYEAVPVWN